MFDFSKDMEALRVDILRRAKDWEPDIINWRRRIHQNPEMGLETPLTSNLVSNALKHMGIEVREGVGGHGVVGILRGENEFCHDMTVALRADMDALLVTEETGLPFASAIPGRMHACGHDGHTAMVLGAAKILSEMKRELKGNVKFIFQPGEEGSGGAKLMIKDGCLEAPTPGAIFGLHLGSLWKGVGTGQVGVKHGPIMAATDRFFITVTGKGGHGAQPHKTVDPIVCASYMVSLLQTIISREVSPTDCALVTVGAFQGGTVANVIPEQCVLQGTVRYVTKDLADYIPKRIEEIAVGVAHAMRANAKVQFLRGYPAVVNNQEMTHLLIDSAKTILGEDGVVLLTEPTMAGEDMALYLQKIPGAYFTLGSNNESKGIIYPNHHPKFDIDEDVLHLGAAVMAQACLDFLK
jgi:amidohydrolase